MSLAGGGKLTAMERPAWGALLVIVYAVLVSLPIVLILAVRPQEHGGMVYQLGRAFALVGISLLALQFILSARLQFIEKPFGLDCVLVFHKAMAVFAFVLILLHPILLAAGGAGWGLLYRTDAPWPIWLGKVAMVLLIFQVVGTSFRARLRVKFESWRLLHNQATLIYVFAFVHSWQTGDDLELPALKGLWIAMLSLAAAAYVYHRAIAPALARRHAYQVSDVRQETHNVWSIRLRRPSGRSRLSFRPGQFHFLTLRRADRRLPVEEHPFTISASPSEDQLASTIKESGDYTSTIGMTKPGDAAAVVGPFGRFSLQFHPGDTDLVFIAGGIGITPLMSMLRYMRDSQAEANVLLLYANRTEGDITFREELEAIAAGTNPRLRVVHVLSQPEESWRGEKGLVDRDMIQRLVGEDLARYSYYICGPPPMMKGVIKAVTGLGVPRDRVFLERFSL